MRYGSLSTLTYLLENPNIFTEFDMARLAVSHHNELQ